MLDNSLNLFNQLKINSEALTSNYLYIKKKAGKSGNSVPVMAMVKADGYGHGVVAAAKAFGRGGCELFGVAELHEAVSLRRAGISGEIYVTVGFNVEDTELFFQHSLTPVIYSYVAAAALSDSALRDGRKIGVHIKVDIGMGRLGLLPDELPQFLHRMDELKGLKLAGIMGHFPEADDSSSVSTLRALETFKSVCGVLKSRGDSIYHIANSGAVLNFPDSFYDMVRAGISLYGYHPAGKSGLEQTGRSKLKPAMSFTSRVIQLRDLPAGTGISYGHIYRTKRPTRMAVIPVGYSHGFARSLSNRGQVLIRGRFAPIRGRICMNMFMADVTDIEHAETGDEVVLLGRQEAKTITADDIAEQIGTISYEVLCMLGNNNKREVVGN